MGVNNTEANVADKLAQALRDLIEACEILGDYAVDTEEFDAAKETLAAHESFADARKSCAKAHEAEKAQAAGSVDCIGLALELEFQSKLVESLATERAMRAAAHGLRLLAGGVAPVAPVAMWQFRHVTEEAWRELVPRTGQTLEVAIAELLGYRVGTRRVYQVRPLFAGPAAPASASEAPVAVPLTDEQLRDALRQFPQDTVGSLRFRWLYAKDFARAVERACAARWGVKLEGGQG